MPLTEVRVGLRQLRGLELIGTGPALGERETDNQYTRNNKVTSIRMYVCFLMYVCMHLCVYIYTDVESRSIREVCMYGTCMYV